MLVNAGVAHGDRLPVPGLIRVKSLISTFIAIMAASLMSSGALAQEPRVIRVAADVYALVGSGDAVTPGNRGRVANAGFIVGPTGVIVIDTGISYRHGRQLLDAIRSVTDRPVKLVILTHAVREFVFGAAAFEEAGATIAAHRATLDLMNARCAYCLEQLDHQLGSEMEHSRLVLPTEIYDTTIRLNVAGVSIDVLHFGWASTPGDVAVFLRDSGTLFAGGLVSADHVPEIRDADFDGWQGALQALLGLPVQRVVPGYGPPSGPQSIRSTAHYLDALDAQAHALYAEDASLLEAIENADLPEFSGWNGYDPNHRRNALHRRLQLEIEDLGGDPRSTALPDGMP